MSFLLRSSGNIQLKEDGPDNTVVNTWFSTVTLKELAARARESILSIEAVNPKTDINPNDIRKAN